MTTQKMKCPICGQYFEKYVSEIKRRKNKKPDAVFYCSRSCASIAIHEKIKFSPIIKTCLNCRKCFETYPGKREKSYCSRSCASKGSVNENRRIAGKNSALVNFTPDTHTTLAVSKRLYEREKYRYVLLENFLSNNQIKYYFEYPIEHYIYDLALPSLNLIIEFDEVYHKYEDETKKTLVAENNGWDIVRIPAKAHEIFLPETIFPFIEDLL